MTAAKHTSAQDPSFRRSLLRNIAGALGLVVAVAAVFGVLGMIGRADPDATGDVAEGSDDPAGSGDAEPESPEDGGAGGQPDDDGAGDDDSEAASTESPPDEDTDPEEAAGPDEGTSEEQPPSEESSAEGEAAPDADPEIDPATISVQVLDGYREDGGAAADEIYEQFESDGYDLIARNPAVAYEVTTVLWTAGHEDEGRQIAELIGAPEAQEQPGNLSTEVDVHVVVGADRG